ncbi:unnamed protein product, partial [Prorocentrum cordatum]
MAASKVVAAAAAVLAMAAMAPALSAAFAGPAGSPLAGSLGVGPLSGPRVGAAAATQRVDPAELQTPGAASAAAVAACVLALAMGARRRQQTPRGLVRMHAGARAMRDTERRAKGVFNHRTERIEWYECGMDTSQAKRVEHHPKGMRGWKDDKCMYEPMKPPARQALGRIFDPICVFKQKEFRLSSPASLDFKEIKETATYMVPKDTSEIVTPAKVPEFLQVRVPSIMERSLGAKRPPQDDAEYAEYADKKCTLADAATKVIPDSFSHDFVADRAALLALLEWGSGTLTPMLRKEGQQNNPIDIVKISKTDGGKALVLDCLYDKMNLYAEQPQKRSKFNPAERPLGGFKDALHLYVTGDQTKNWNIKGYSQHVKDHNLPKCYKFLDVPIDGLKLTVRAPKTHVHKGRRYLDEE